MNCHKYFDVLIQVYQWLILKDTITNGCRGWLAFIIFTSLSYSWRFLGKCLAVQSASGS